MLIAGALFVLTAARTPADLGPVPAGAVRVYLVRHGQSFSNLNPPPDLPADQLDRLTPLGQEQAHADGSALRDRGVTLLLSSPAGRARETAAIMGSVLGKAEIRTEPALRPLDLGRSAEGRPFTWDDRIAAWKAGRDPAPARGESMEQLGKRVLGLVEALRKERPGASVALVAHSEVIGALLGLVQGKPPAARYPPGLANGSISVAEADGASPPKLVFMNYIPTEPAPPAR